MIKKAFEVYKNEAFRMLDVIARYTAACEQIEPQLAAIMKEEGYQRYWSLNIKNGQTPGIFVVYHLEKDETLKAVKPILDLAVEQGWEAKPSEDFMGGYGISYPFEQKIEIAGQKHTLYLTLRVFPHPNSQVCKKVVVGTEPKYEIRCSEGGA